MRKWVSLSVRWFLKIQLSVLRLIIDSGETILKGMGELHLDIKVDILKRTYGVELVVGQPQVAYRETITREVEDSYTHKKQSGGSGQYGKIDYRIRPGEQNSGFTFKSTVVGGSVPKEFYASNRERFLKHDVNRYYGWLPSVRRRS